MNKRILIISGPTGSGESTVTNLLIKKYPIFKRLITATTRKPRLKEKNKKDYFFFTNKQFQSQIKQGNILEYTYIKNRNVYYGTYKPDLEKKLKQGFNLIANTDYKGTNFYKKYYRAIGIFLKAESLAVIKKRLLARQPGLSASELKKRLNNAAREIKKEEKYYKYKVINRQGQLNKTLEKIVKILTQENYKLKK
jgi:guanylate kinase